MHVYSINNTPIIVSQRVARAPGAAMRTVFAQMMALTNEQLSASCVMPWSSKVDLNTELRFAVP